MATVAELAAELKAQPYEIAAFADLGNVPDDYPLSADLERAIREAWNAAPTND